MAQDVYDNDRHLPLGNHACVTTGLKNTVVNFIEIGQYDAILVNSFIYQHNAQQAQQLITMNAIIMTEQIQIKPFRNFEQ